MMGSIWALRPAALDIGLGEAMVSLIESIQRITDLQIKVETHDGGRLKRDIEVSVYRSVQEALTNVRRRADAKAVWILTVMEPRRVRGLRSR